MVKEIPPKKARQGGTGTQVLMVLLGGLLLAVIVWGAVEIYGWSIAPEQPSGDPSTPVADEAAPQQQPAGN